MTNKCNTWSRQKLSLQIPLEYLLTFSIYVCVCVCVKNHASNKLNVIIFEFC